MPFESGQSGNPKGRTPKATKFAKPIAEAEKRIADRLPHLIDKMLTLADGVTVQVVDEDTGGVEIFVRPPDRQALEYLINRIMGKPTERVEHDFDPTTLTDEELWAIVQGKSRR